MKTSANVSMSLHFMPKKVSKIRSKRVTKNNVNILTREIKSKNVGGNNVDFSTSKKVRGSNMDF